MRRQGFTLLETLIALTVFAVAAGGFIAAGSQGIRQMQALEQKMLAAWVAQNRLAELRAGRLWPDTGTRQERVTFAARPWTVRVHVVPTPHAGMRMLEVSVAPDAQATPLVTLTGFTGRQ
jgi:general secretion pathway protein I